MKYVEFCMCVPKPVCKYKNVLSLDFHRFITPDCCAKSRCEEGFESWDDGCYSNRGCPDVGELLLSPPALKICLLKCSGLIKRGQLISQNGCDFFFLAIHQAVLDFLIFYSMTST